MHKNVFFALALSLTSASAVAAESYPALGTNVPTGGIAYSAPYAPNNTNYADTNGDGFLEMSELPPDSQLAKRFGTRDANKDGKLSRDEYFFK